MTKNIEDQIRRYTEDLYERATPVERLAAEAIDRESDHVHRVGHRTRARRSLNGPAVAVVAAVAALLAVVPLWLLAGGRSTPSTPEATSATTVPSGPLGPFAGTWIGFDEVDGSTNTLVVDGATNEVVYHETAATACRDPFGEIVSGSVTGSATVDGDRMEFTGTFYCDLASGSEPVPFFEDHVWVVAYDPDTDTLRLLADPTSILYRSREP